MLKIYLAGNIAGHTYADARHCWRRTIAKRLHPKEFAVFSPMRDWEEMDWDKVIDDKDVKETGFVLRDLWDVDQCDVIVAKLDWCSIGTAMEMGWAAKAQKLLLVIASNEAIARHPFIRQLAWMVVPDEEIAITQLKKLKEGV